ncbi:hypothetical protein [[Mycobacterium] fortunisiensis]|nr:hypothetical protein [[Mycobacterium] fortunisiensis]
MASIKLADRHELAEPLDDGDPTESGDTDLGEDDASDFAEPIASQRKWLRWVAVGGLAVLVPAMAAAGGFFGWHYGKDRQIANAGAAALNTANSYAVTLTSVDTNNLDANFAAVLDGSTGEFQDMYAKSSSELRKLLIDHKATGHGTVVDSAVKSASPDEVVVLLFVDQTVTNTEVPDPRVDRSRMVMTMHHVDGRWKAAKVELP